MQVKKFEAKSMKEALQMVKQELGPEAIILQAKSRKNGFGLVGAGSVEVTAAISEKAIARRSSAENHLPEKIKTEFRNKSARHQKEFIEQMTDRLQNGHSSQETAAPRASASRRYIDIGDEPSPARAAYGGRTVADVLDEVSSKSNRSLMDDAANGARPRPAAGDRVRGLSVQAATALAQFIKRQAREDADDQAEMRREQQRQSQQRPRQQTKPISDDSAIWNGGDEELVSLRSEVDGLRKMLARFQSSKPMTAHPGAEYDLPYDLSPSFERLQQAGIDTRYIVEILQKANAELNGLEKKKRSLVDAWVARYILSQVNIGQSWSGSKSKFHFFVGPNGQGKTATLVKLASQLVLQEKKKIAIFTTDTMKVGTADQLKIYANILGVPFEVIRGHYDYQTLPNKHKDKDFVLIDVPGFSLRELPEIDQLKNILPPAGFSRHTHLVVSCTLRDIDAFEMSQRYQVSRFDDIIITKLDESFSHGLLYNVQRRTEKPLFAFGIGPKIPEDMEMATRERVLDLIFKISKSR